MSHNVIRYVHIDVLTKLLLSSFFTFYVRSSISGHVAFEYSKINSDSICRLFHSCIPLALNTVTPIYYLNNCFNKHSMNTYFMTYFTVLCSLHMMSFHSKPYQRSIVTSSLRIKQPKLKEISEVK